MLLEMGVVAVHPNNLTETQTPGHVIGAVQALFSDNANGRVRRRSIGDNFRHTRD